MSATANARSSKERWTKVTKNKLALLEQRSKKRVAKDKVLQEVLKDVKEGKDDEGPTSLAEVRKEAKKKDNYGDEDAAKNEYERKKKAFVDEGVNIVVDLIGLDR